MLIASAVLALIMAVAISVMIASTRSHEISSIGGALDGQVERVLQDISDNIRQADLGTLLVTPNLVIGPVPVPAILPPIALPPGLGVPLLSPTGLATLLFKRVTGFDNSKNVNVTNPGFLLYVYFPDSGELINGLDDNGNGLIDEGILQKITDDLPPKIVTLTHWIARHAEPVDGVDNNGNGLVDEPGFAVVQTNRRITITLTLEKVDSQGRIVSSNRTTSTTLRN